MSSALYICIDCQKPVVLSPPLSAREGSDGRPMTRQEALCLFRVAKGGRCVDCYLKHRDAQPVPARRKFPSTVFPDRTDPRDWVRL